MDIDYFIKNPSEFTRNSREYEGDAPEGEWWRVTVQHTSTGKYYRYFEDDIYANLIEQIKGGDEPDWEETFKTPYEERVKVFAESCGVENYGALPEESLKSSSDVMSDSSRGKVYYRGRYDHVYRNIKECDNSIGALALEDLRRLQ